MENVKILAVVGMSGSGKGTAIESLEARGVPSVYFGGIVYGAMEAAGVERTPDGESEKIFRQELREREGKDFVVRRAIKMVHDLIGAGQRRIVLDGVYSWTEYKLLKKEFPGAMTVVAVVAAREERYRRVAARTDRAFDRKAIMERDYAEIENLEKGGPIAIADYYLLNDGTREELQEKMEGVARKVGLIE